MKPNTRNILISGLFALSYCISAQWNIEITGSSVPISLQSFFILTLSCFLKPKFSFLAIVLYLLLGLIGLPVFSDGKSGIDAILGNTGGYLIGFIPAAIFMSWAILKNTQAKFWPILGSMLLATLIILCFGYIALASKIGALNAFNHGITPFIPGGILKAIIGSSIVYFVLRYNK
jgi:biotin transport system substrate-specific component